MNSKILVTEKLENLLQTRWAEIIDHRQLLLTVMQDVRDTPFETIRQQQIPSHQTRLVVTKVSVQSEYFEFWAEFSIPRDSGVVVGTGIYALRLSGELRLKQLVASNFQPETI